MAKAPRGLAASRRDARARRGPRFPGTAADVALFHTTPSGGRGIVFVETKYHEDLKNDDATWKPRYDEVICASDAFTPAARARITTGSLQQIALDHLLALATREADGLDTVLFSLVYSEENPACRTADASYRELLTSDGRSTYEGRKLESVVDVIEHELPDAWVRELRGRYLGR